ncbi:hypothetical protein TREMEDRAFT_31036, partial [Tremella mesenterica DSM 1558]|uniref:uncharacterized protein n=1 Tax=Tremella mesenterica (strain ATCC 24925 / CBS 8224 / DSM 1558 / NBRC 9311 / NRRL Y-6157 / RJB 2259-6 / UBC 559-6) TaxID=578456 RepID=UPI0003F49036
RVRSKAVTPTSHEHCAMPEHQGKPVNPLNPTGLKPCCACPETKSARDDCFLKHPPEVAALKCEDYVSAHKACMRSLGFNV